MKRKIKHTVLIASFVFGMTFTPFISAKPKEPILIDYQIGGLDNLPSFQPNKLFLLVGQPYLFMIDNPSAYQMTFFYDRFGKTIYTHYLQGVSGVSQTSITIPSHSKVTWLLEINKPGEYEVYAINNGIGQRGSPSKLIVAAAPEDNASKNIDSPYRFDEAMQYGSEESAGKLREADNNKVATVTLKKRKSIRMGGSRD